LPIWFPELLPGPVKPLAPVGVLLAVAGVVEPEQVAVLLDGEERTAANAHDVAEVRKAPANLISLVRSLEAQCSRRVLFPVSAVLEKEQVAGLVHQENRRPRPGGEAFSRKNEHVREGVKATPDLVAGIISGSREAFRAVSSLSPFPMYSKTSDRRWA
jgi:hypothetical protein